MKILIYVGVSFLFLTTTGYAQCECDTIIRGDGDRVVQCNPLPVAYDNETQVGLAAASNGESNFVAVMVRFQNTAKKIVNGLTLRTESNHMITLPLVNSDIVYIGNSQLAQAVFLLGDDHLNKIKSSMMYTLSFELSDRLQRTYQVEMHPDVLMKQASCL